MHLGESEKLQSLSLIQVMSLLPDRLYPGIQSISTIVPWSTGSEVLVVKSKIFGNSVHFSGKTNPDIYIKVLSRISDRLS